MYKIITFLLFSLVASGCASQLASDKVLSKEELQLRKQQMELIRTMDLMNQPQVINASRV